jgi:hypothetical protein
MTRWIPIALAAGVLMAGCSDDNSTGPTNLPIVFSALLSPASEVPPVGNAESGGSGSMQISFDVNRDATGGITDGTASVYISFSGYPAGTRVVGAHIHPGAAGVNGPVLVPTAISAAAPFVLTDGSGEYRASGITVSGANLAAIAANPAGFYFNVHSPLNPGGFSRGQLRRVQ